MSTGLCRLAASGPAARPGKRVGRQPTQDSHSTPYFRPMTWLPGKGSEVDKILPTGRHAGGRPSGRFRVRRCTRASGSTAACP